MTFFPRVRFSLQRKFILSIVLIIVPVLGVIFTWAGIRGERNATVQVLKQARILSRQIILTRQWISDCGGVMVARESAGAREVRYFFDDRLLTQRGTFNRFTPAMVTKKLSEYSLRENLYRFRLASLNPMNPQNTPDAFEKMALYRFIHQDIDELFLFDREGENQIFRYTVPLFVDKACMECHKDFTKGTVGGCLSILFPASEFMSTLRSTRIRLAVAGTALIVLTIATLFFLLRRVVINPLSALETATAEISKGNLDARVKLETGDEFEHLGRTFNTMGDKLAHHRETMEERITQATSELSEANRELTKLDSLKTEFIADMSHELRSPITAIRGGLDYLKRTTPEGDNKSYLHLIDNNLMRMTHLVSDMLDLTRIDAGKVAWDFELNDLSVLVREVIEVLSLEADKHQVQMHFDERDSVWVEMDLERIEQVLVNLLENAFKFSDPGTAVTITIEENDPWVAVSVCDAGKGIASENLETIFRKFHTLPSSGGRGQTKGTGLGLTICRKIVEAHGGRIWAESEQGQGSTFTFRLPLKQSS